jgi:alkanesulfonate monooxygenase SsuD/methylene tetrahydromethanopterin reductase-like flavin-dependent oxidoreductase (luciferase family)
VGLAAPGAAPARVDLSSASPFELDGDLKEAALFGSPDTIAAKLAEIAALGIERVVAFIHIGGLRADQVKASVELFAREAIPAAGLAVPAA